MRLGEHKNTSTDYGRARDLRNNASLAERKLWCVLREGMKQRNLKFRRQHAVHPYIVDFACMAARLLVELDGNSHDLRRGYDAARDANLRQRGFSILRFSNNDVLENAEGVAESILCQAERLIQTGKGRSQPHSPLPNPPHEGEGTFRDYRNSGERS